MRLLYALVLLVAWIGPGRAATQPCPIESVVAQIGGIDGDAAQAHVSRGGQMFPAEPDMCLLYGDRVEAGGGVKVEINTGDGGQKIIGGSYDPEWDAPQPRGEVSSDLAAAVRTLYADVMSPARNRVVYTTGRGAPAGCGAAARSRLAPLGRLSRAEQDIGADLRSIAVGWTSGGAGGRVTSSLTREGRGVARASVCTANHLVIGLPPAALAPGDTLLLELRAGGSPALVYRLHVVEPAALPRPRGDVGADWLLGAWRLAAAGPRNGIDAVSRLQAAPPEALPARRILQAVWTEQPL